MHTNRRPEKGVRPADIFKPQEYLPKIEKESAYSLVATAASGRTEMLWEVSSEQSEQTGRQEWDPALRCRLSLKLHFYLCHVKSLYRYPHTTKQSGALRVSVIKLSS